MTAASQRGEFDAAVLAHMRKWTTENLRTVTYIIRNCLLMDHGIQTDTASIRHALGRLEAAGLVKSRKWSHGCMIEYWAVTP